METGKKEKIYKIVMLVIITIILTFMVTSIGMYNYFTKTKKGALEISKSIEVTKNIKDLDEKLEKVKEYLKEYYIGDLDTEKMEEMAIKGYVEGVGDLYTEYLTKDEYNELLVNITGDYVGIGIYMSQNNDGDTVVVMPIEGSPAEEAGLKSGDIIKTIDGEEVTGIDINVVAAKIKGEANTTVKLEIIRENEKIEKTIIRKKIELPSSSSKILNGNIGYIQLTAFDENCSDDIVTYLEEFQKKGVKSVVLDLRNNTGGIVLEAIKISNQFIKKDGIIMRSYDKDGVEKIIKSDATTTADMKLVVLVNEYSASATEILTAALKDNKVATIVGTKTYGKGVMQEINPIFDGAIKVTIEEFKTPNGDTINKSGIMPDIIIEDDLETEDDEQLNKALDILK